MTQRSKRPNVKIIIGHLHLAVVDPPLADLIPLLVSHRKQVDVGGPTGVNVVETSIAMSVIDIRGRIGISAGLLPRIVAFLEDRGHRCEIVDLRNFPELLIDEDFVTDVSNPKWLDLLSAIRRNFLGQIEVAHGRSVSETLGVIARAFSQARIAIAVPTRKSAYRIWRSQREEYDVPAGLAVGPVVANRHRVVVGTFQSIPEFAEAALREQKLQQGLIKDADYSNTSWDMLVFPFGELSIGSTACDCVSRCHPSRRFAFIRPHRRRDQLVEERLEQIAGSVIHQVGHERAAIRCLLVPNSNCSVRSNAKSPREFKALLYWRNRERNRHIALLAKAIAGGDRKELADWGFDSRVIEFLEFPNERRIAILVENTVHAEQLSRLLPQWQTVSAAPVCEPLKNFDRLGLCLIATEMYALKHRVGADVVIRATGTPWPMQMKSFPPRYSRRTHSVLIVDFEDSFSDVSQRHTRERACHYRQDGADVITLVPRS